MSGIVGVVNFEKEVEAETWRVKLKKLLNDLGEDFSTMGYGVMCDIIEFVEQNPKYKEHFLVKELYAPVISKTGRTYCQIERNIRAMIERVYNNNSVERVHSVLGISEESYEKMANAKFIALVIDRVL